MNNRWRLIFVIPFTICADQPLNNMKYDLTNVLNDAIIRLLKSSNLVEKLVSEIFIKESTYYCRVHKINNTQKLQPFGNNTIDITHLYALGSTSNLRCCHKHNTIHWELSKNELGIKLEKSPEISYKQHLKLIYIISSELQSIMRNFFTNAPNFNALLRKISKLNPKGYINSARPDFFINEQQYYYLIPDISYVHMSFKNITIRGLSNFESYTNHQSRKNRHFSDDRLVYALHVRNVRGNMTLITGFEYFPHFPLNFFIGNLYISRVQEDRQIIFNVEAQDYYIVTDHPQSPTLISSWISKCSTSIIQLIELAIEDSMMPSKKAEMGKVNPVSWSPQMAEIEASFAEALENFTT